MLQGRAWIEAYERSPLSGALARHDEARGSAFRRLAESVITEAWRAWRVAEESLAEPGLPGRPWADPRYAVRVLERLATLTPLAQAGAAETWLLSVAPFVREAVQAVGFAWIADAERLEGGDALQQVLRS